MVRQVPSTRRPCRHLGTGPLVAAVVAVTLLAASCTSTPSQAGPSTSPSGSTAIGRASSVADPAADPRLARYYEQTLDWRPCESASGAPDFQCARLTVPVDYAEPGGATTYLAAHAAARRRPGRPDRLPDRQPRWAGRLRGRIC